MKIFKYMALALAAVVTMGCVQEQLEIDQNKIPQASELKINIVPDQETNYVTFSIENKGMTPMWIFGDEKIDGKANKKHAYYGNDIKLRFRDAGEYSVEVKAYNAHGMSVGSQVRTFTLNNTYRDPFDPSKYITMLAGSESKTWEWNSTKDGHFGCGPTAGDPASWWSASAGNKEGMGLYDDRMTFSADGKYTYNPGEGGTVYVNTGSGYGNDYNTNDGQDYQVPIESFTVEYTFENSWNDDGIEEVYLVLAEGANLSYIPNQAALDDPRYLILEQTTKLITLAHYSATANNGTPIAWKYQFVPEGSAVVTPPATEDVVFDPNSDRNLWKTAKKDEVSYWFANNDWGQIDNPAYTVENDVHTLVIPEGIGGQQWQGQFVFNHTGIIVDPAKTYDFQVVLNSTADHPHVTVKACYCDPEQVNDQGEPGKDVNEIFMKGDIVLTAYEDYAYQVKGVQGTDIPDFKLVFDFGGAEGGSTVTIKDIVFQEHVGGAEVPSGPAPFDPVADENMWKDAAITVTYWFANSSWGQIADPEATIGSNEYVFVVPAEVGGAEWQGQIKFEHTGLVISPDKTYDFRVMLNSTADGTATIKPCYQHPTELENGNPKDVNPLFYDNAIALTAYEDLEYVQAGLQGTDIPDLKLVLDLGRFPGGATVTVKGIVIRESQTVAPEPEEPTVLDPSSDANMWKNAKTDDITFWFANDGWTQIADPELTAENGVYTLIIPEGTGASQWQGQMAINHTGLVVTPGKTYDFQVTLQSSADHPHVTVKGCWEDPNETDSNQKDKNEIFYKNDIKLVAYEDYVYTATGLAGTDIPDFKLVFDFGGATAGSEVIISGITLVEH